MKVRHAKMPRTAPKRSERSCRHFDAKHTQLPQQKAPRKMLTIADSALNCPAMLGGGCGGVRGDAIGGMSGGWGGGATGGGETGGGDAGKNGGDTG